MTASCKSIWETTSVQRPRCPSLVASPAMTSRPAAPTRSRTDTAPLVRRGVGRNSPSVLPNEALLARRRPWWWARPNTSVAVLSTESTRGSGKNADLTQLPPLRRDLSPTVSFPSARLRRAGCPYIAPLLGHGCSRDASIASVPVENVIAKIKARKALHLFSRRHNLFHEAYWPRPSSRAEELNLIWIGQASVASGGKAPRLAGNYAVRSGCIALRRYRVADRVQLRATGSFGEEQGEHAPRDRCQHRCPARHASVLYGRPVNLGFDNDDPEVFVRTLEVPHDQFAWTTVSFFCADALSRAPSCSRTLHSQSAHTSYDCRNTDGATAVFVPKLMTRAIAGGTARMA